MRCRMIKSQANIATRHDTLVYFFEANVVGNVATSWPMAKRMWGTNPDQPQCGGHGGGYTPTFAWEARVAV